MKGRIHIDTEECMRIGDNLQTLSDGLSDCAASLGRVVLTNDAGGKLPINLSGALRTVSGKMPDGQVRDAVQQIRALIRQLGAYSDRLAVSTNRAAELFDRTERQLAAMQMSQAQEAVFSSGGAGGGGNPNAGSGSFDWLQHLPDIFQGGDGEFQQVTEYGSSLIYNAAGLAAVVIGNIHAVFDGITEGIGRITDSLSWSLGGQGEHEPVVPHALAALSGDIEGTDGPNTGSGLGFSISRSGEKYDWKLSVDFCKTTRTGSAAVGTGNAVKNGKYEGHTGFGAEKGISFTLFEASASGNYELIDNVRLQGNMTVSAGKFGAQAEAVAGYDENGQSDVHASVGAEALLGEIESEFGLNINGVQSTIEADVGYGIGAEAEVGFKDGKPVAKVDPIVGWHTSVDGKIGVRDRH